MRNKKLHRWAGILTALVGMALVTFIPHAYMYNWDRGAVFGLVLIVGAGKELVWDKWMKSVIMFYFTEANNCIKIVVYL